VAGVWTECSNQNVSLCTAYQKQTAEAQMMLPNSAGTLIVLGPLGVALAGKQMTTVVNHCCQAVAAMPNE
jgi:hypothetical protein